MLKVQYITCEGTRAELHQIPASLWQMPEAGGRGGGCSLDGEKIFEHLDQQAAAPPYLRTLRIRVALAASNSW